MARQEHLWWSRKGSAVPWSTFHLQPPNSSCLDQHHLYRHKSHRYFLSCLSQIRSVNCLLACNLTDSGVRLIVEFGGLSLFLLVFKFTTNTLFELPVCLLQFVSSCLVSMFCLRLHPLPTFNYTCLDSIDNLLEI